MKPRIPLLNMGKCYNIFVVSPNVAEVLKNLPLTPGVYIYKDKSGQVIYVGKAKNLKSRVTSYFRLNIGNAPKTKALVKEIDSIEIINVESELEALILEAELIKKFTPHYNIQLKDDKSYLYIGIRDQKVDVDGKITNLPIIETFRKADLTKYKYYHGPYPDGRSVKQLLRLLRKIFPYRDCSFTKYVKYKHLGSPCLYGHINLCPAPCVYGGVAVKEHRNHVSDIKNILSGKTQNFIKNYKKIMYRYAKEKEYEKAVKVRDVINKFAYVQQTYRLPSEYIENPMLIEDLASMAMEDLKDILPVLKELPTRIECYDISNISGKESVGSMVTSINGRIDKSGYKRFRIKYKNTPDDFYMLYEVLYRRLRHEIDPERKKWGVPSLIVLDGGKGQLSSGMEVLKKLNLDIPMIGLAKKEETLVYFDGNEFIEIRPELSSPGMKLLINLRDESHRFAQKYHHLLRSKKTFGLNS